jgi:hypothetical protein
MLALIALFQVSAATPSSLDAARQALRHADTAAAVAALATVLQTDTVYDSQDVAAVLLLRWIGRSPAHKDALAPWQRTWPTLDPTDTVRWDSSGARAALLVLRALDRGGDDRDIQEGPIHEIRWQGEARARGISMHDTTMVIGIADSLPGPSWEARLRAISDTTTSRDSLLIATLRWLAVAGWLGNLNRFAFQVPEVDAPPGCSDGCLLLRQPPPDLPLLERLRATGPAAAELDSLWTARNRAPSLNRAETLDSLWVALDDMRPSPWPFDELAERLRVTLCALLQLGTEVNKCAPLTTTLDTVVAAELKAVRYEFDGHRRLAAKAMDAAPERFTALDRSLDLLITSTTGRMTEFYLDGRWRREEERIPVRTALPPGFWQASWPLYLEPINERLIAHRARLLLADMSQRFVIGDLPNLFGAWGEPGMLVRIGVPLALARPAIQHGKRFPLVTYVAQGTYETLVRPRPGMAGVSLDFALAARSPINPGAVSGFLSEDYDTFGPLDHQVVDFVRDGRHQVEVYTRWDAPLVCRDPSPRLGFFLMDAGLRSIAPPTELDPRTPPPLKRFHLELAPGSYVYSLELLDRSCRDAKRARYVLTVKPVEATRASDMVLADELYFGDDRWVRRIAGRPPVTPRPSLTFDAGDAARFYWELYGVAADSMQRGRLRVIFEVVNVHDQRVPVRDLGQLAAAARRTRGTLDLRYDLSIPPGDGPLGFGLAVGLPEGTHGVHVARARLTDLKTKKTLTVERAFFVR